LVVVDQPTTMEAAVAFATRSYIILSRTTDATACAIIVPALDQEDDKKHRSTIVCIYGGGSSVVVRSLSRRTTHQLFKRCWLECDPRPRFLMRAFEATYVPHVHAFTTPHHLTLYEGILVERYMAALLDRAALADAVLPRHMLLPSMPPPMAPYGRVGVCNRFTIAEHAIVCYPINDAAVRALVAIRLFAECAPEPARVDGPVVLGGDGDAVAARILLHARQTRLNEPHTLTDVTPREAIAANAFNCVFSAHAVGIGNEVVEAAYASIVEASSAWGDDGFDRRLLLALVRACMRVPEVLRHYTVPGTYLSTKKVGVRVAETLGDDVELDVVTRAAIAALQSPPPYAFIHLERPVLVSVLVATVYEADDDLWPGRHFVAVPSLLVVPRTLVAALLYAPSSLNAGDVLFVLAEYRAARMSWRAAAVALVAARRLLGFTSAPSFASEDALTAALARADRLAQLSPGALDVATTPRADHVLLAGNARLPFVAEGVWNSGEEAPESVERAQAALQQSMDFHGAHALARFDGDESASSSSRPARASFDVALAGTIFAGERFGFARTTRVRAVASRLVTAHDKALHLELLDAALAAGASSLVLTAVRVVVYGERSPHIFRVPKSAMLPVLPRAASLVALLTAHTGAVAAQRHELSMPLEPPPYVLENDSRVVRPFPLAEHARKIDRVLANFHYVIQR